MAYSSAYNTDSTAANQQVTSDVAATRAVGTAGIAGITAMENAGDHLGDNANFSDSGQAGVDASADAVTKELSDAASGNGIGNANAAMLQDQLSNSLTANPAAQRQALAQGIMQAGQTTGASQGAIGSSLLSAKSRKLLADIHDQALQMQAKHVKNSATEAGANLSAEGKNTQTELQDSATNAADAGAITQAGADQAQSQALLGYALTGLQGLASGLGSAAGTISSMPDRGISPEASGMSISPGALSAPDPSLSFGSGMGDSFAGSGPNPYSSSFQLNLPVEPT